MSTIRLIGLISFFGQCYFFVPVMTPYLLQRNLTLAEIAGLQTMLMVSMLVMEVPTGVIADRLGHVWSYRIALITLAAGEFLFLSARDYPVFLAIQFITGTGFAFSSGSVDAIIYEHLPEGDRVIGMQRAKGTIGAAAQVGSVVAYSIGGVIAADLTLTRMTITIVMGALAVTTAAMLSFALREAPHVANRERQNSLALLGTAWQTIRHSPSLLRLMAFAIATNAFGALQLVLYQQYFLATGVPGVWFGLGLSLASVAVVLASLHAWRLPRLIGTRWATILSAGLPGVLYLAMAWNGMAWLAVVLFVLQWGAMHLLGPILAGLYNAHIPGEARATTLSVINALVTVYIGAGGVLLGWLAERSLTGTFALLGTVIVAASVLIRVDERHAVSPVASAPARAPG
jgi:predicted MFS family arabinose efflux permease